jgi:hypothetical protein
MLVGSELLEIPSQNVVQSGYGVNAMKPFELTKTDDACAEYSEKLK